MHKLKLKKLPFSGEELLEISSADMKNYWGDYPPAKLHDGNLYNFAHSYGTHDGMWIRMFLMKRSTITRILVYNRSTSQERIVGASTYIKSGDQYVKHCGDFKTAKRKYDFRCVGLGDGVEVSQQGNVVDWNLAEIQIFGSPLLSPGLL